LKKIISTNRCKKDTGNLAENKKLKKVGQNRINSETYNVYINKN